MVTTKDILKALETVKDPEIPVISVVDMGIIRKVEVLSADYVKVYMTPTFVGCPAINIMQQQVKVCVEKMGIDKVEVIVDFDQPWTSNLITEKGKQQLKGFGLAPPPKITGEVSDTDLQGVECPNCGSHDTSLNNPFGPTLCRAIHYCNHCHQAFQQFKPV